MKIMAVQIIGQTILSIKKAFLSDKLATKFIVKAVGEDIDPTKFYPARAFLQALRDIGTKMSPTVLKKVGAMIIESAKWPPGVDSFEDGLQSISVAYKMNHRPNDVNVIGDYIYEKKDDKSWTLTCTNPYPCDFDEGIIKGVAKAFNAHVNVKHAVGDCRKNGNRKCVYLINKF